MIKDREKFVTRARFGEIAGGVSGAGIKGAIDRGHVVVNYKVDKKGLIDIENTLNLEYINKKNPQRPNHVVKSSSVSDEDISGAKPESLSEDGLKKRLLLAKVNEKELKNDIERGKYIDAELVIILLKNLEVVDQKQLMNMGRNSAPKVVTIMRGDESYISAVAAEIEGEAWKIIAEKKNMMEVFLEGLDK